MFPNNDNIRKAIAVMERVKGYEETYGKKLLDMRYFRYPIVLSGVEDFTEIPKTEESFIHACGTTCCFAGWIAISPEFREQGVYCNDEGFPQIKGNDELRAHEIISQLLEIPPGTAAKLIYGDDFYHKDNLIKKCMFEITIDDVIERLNSFLPKDN